jgi:hypothetical protein
LLYLEVAKQFQARTLEQRCDFLYWIEQHYISEADTDLGDFLNRVMIEIYFHLEDDQLPLLLYDCVEESDLNRSMLFTVGSTLLSKLYTGQEINFEISC